MKNSKETIERFLKCKETDIFEMFHDHAKGNCTIFGRGNFTSMLIPGERDDRALLVAHVDTVWNDSMLIKPEFHDGLLFSGFRSRGVNKKGHPFNEGIGIGADDRAGIAILWGLKDLGHSLLLTGSEESGCLGSTLIMSSDENAKLINEHQFAVQFDRKGKNDLVYYDVSTPAFEKYCKRQTGYKWAAGSYTDICVLCEQICGVNISVGYKNEHAPTEILNLRWWNRTYNVSRDWLSQKKLPYFPR